MSDYTPTMIEISMDYGRYGAMSSEEEAERRAAFRRWLRAHHAEVAGKAWDRCVASMIYSDGTPVEIVTNTNPYR